MPFIVLPSLMQTLYYRARNDRGGDSFVQILTRSNKICYSYRFPAPA